MEVNIFCSCLQRSRCEIKRLRIICIFWKKWYAL